MNDLTLVPDRGRLAPIHQLPACYLEAQTVKIKLQLPSGNCYNWGIKTDDVKWKSVFYWMNVHSAFIHTHTHTSVWLWLTGVLALGLCVCAAAVPGERQGDDRESKRGCFFVFTKISTKWIIRWVDLPLTSPHAGWPFCGVFTFAALGLQLLSVSSSSSSPLWRWGLKLTFTGLDFK